MIIWFLIGVISAAYSYWDYFIRKPKRTSTVTHGELIIVNTMIVLLGPLSILYIIGYEIINNKTIKNWWNKRI